MILENRNGELRDPRKSQRMEIEPPPYTSDPSGHAHPSPAHRAAELTRSSNKPLPPTHPHPSPPGGLSSLPKQSSPRAPPSPRPSVSQVHIQERANEISGTYYIDPSFPSLGFDAGRNKARKKSPPHASFRTRQGPISLDLGTTGDATAEVPKANVLVSTRSGNISIKLMHSLPSLPRLGLEVLSRGGNIVFFIPKSFSGVIQLNTRKGNRQILPALASSMKVLKESDTEALILVGDHSATESRDVDFCQLNTRHGKLIVGLSDIDAIDVKVGFWKKLFGGTSASDA
ncbi:hypothetical protein FPV67DRAFT_1665471 [Lyophyllum atratum]|nr:hypothetical protein FPV67DRAFT_1665471 [Lyophyllum atratum]